MRRQWIAALTVLAVCALWAAAMTHLSAEPCREDVVHRMDSVVFESVKYEGESQALTLAFRHGGAYLYENVPRWVYRGFMATPRKAQYYQAHIKGKYPSVRLDAVYEDNH